MKNLVVLGGGTAGTMLVNKLCPRLDATQWRITLVDRDDAHPYQPGFLFIPFGHAADVRSRRSQVHEPVRVVLDEIDRVDSEEQVVFLASGRELDYDYLVIASGTSPHPEQTPGMLGPLWRQSIFDFYTLDGALALAAALTTFDRGRFGVHITDMPIKCPVAPLVFTFLADDWFRRHGVRDAVELVFVTPLSAAFTRPVAADRLGSMLEDRGVVVEPDFLVEHIDDDAKTLVSYDGRIIGFDLLVTVPGHMGADFVGRSGLGDDLQFVPVDRHTFESKADPRIFAIGDAADLPTSKAGSVAHFSVDVFADNFVDLVHGMPMTRAFDGHANCFIESGHHKALLIDFNYETEPLPGSYPAPFVGPLSLLKESRTNHLGKLAFQWIYWHLLLPGRPIPLPSAMSMTGKHETPEMRHAHHHD